MCNNVGPGPGAYMLPPETGYVKHDPARYRNPQYTMAQKLQALGKGLGPGPVYDPGKYTRFGKATPNAFSIYSRNKELTRFCGPGPNAYSLDPENKKMQNPAYSIYSRVRELTRFQIPAANAYKLPDMIGPKIVNKQSGAAYSLVGNHGLSAKNKSPGPAAYDDIQKNIYKPRQPIYTMRPVNKFGKCQPGPGPAAYLPNMPKSCSGGYSFGLRLGCKTRPYITADDALPCITHDK